MDFYSAGGKECVKCACLESNLLIIYIEWIPAGVAPRVYNGSIQQISLINFGLLFLTILLFNILIELLSGWRVIYDTIFLRTEDIKLYKKKT